MSASRPVSVTRELLRPLGRPWMSPSARLLGFLCDLGFRDLGFSAAGGHGALRNEGALGLVVLVRG